jgi:hypothetical protein
MTRFFRNGDVLRGGPTDVSRNTDAYLAEAITGERGDE